MARPWEALTEPSLSVCPVAVLVAVVCAPFEIASRATKHLSGHFPSETGPRSGSMGS